MIAITTSSSIKVNPEFMFRRVTFAVFILHSSHSGETVRLGHLPEKSFPGDHWSGVPTDCHVEADTVGLDLQVLDVAGHWASSEWWAQECQQEYSLRAVLAKSEITQF